MAPHNASRKEQLMNIIHALNSTQHRHITARQPIPSGYVPKPQSLSLLERRALERFEQKFAGPYHYRDGNDGVDATLDIHCMWGEETLTSTYYWDDKVMAEHIAEVISAAMNERTGWHEFLQLPHPIGWAEFLAVFPGSYKIRRNRCEYRGGHVEVVCQTTGKSIVQCFDHGRRGDGKRIAVQIAAALNALLDSPIAHRRCRTTVDGFVAIGSSLS